MKKITFVLLSFLVAVVVASCAKKETAETPKPAVVSGIKTETVKSSLLEDFYEAVGTVRARKASALSSKTVGQVTAVLVREGDAVRAGQVLVEVDDREAASQLLRAQAGLQEAQQALAEAEQMIRASESARAAAEADKNLAASTFRRYEVLRERHSVSPQEFEEVQAKYQAKTAESDRAQELVNSMKSKREQVLARIEQAKAAIALARVSVGYGRVVAPYPGVITAKQVEVGALASPGTPLLTVEDNKNFRLEALVEESRLGKVRIGQNLQVIIDALGTKEWQGRVAEISPAADPASRTSVVKIDLSDGNRGLRSGLFGKARFAVEKRLVMAVPRTALIQRGQMTEVFVVDSRNVAHMTLVKTGRESRDRAEILSGLREGDRIIVAGVEKVSDGNRVEEASSSEGVGAR